MSELNMNNQNDQKSNSTIEYIGRVYIEYKMLSMEIEEETKNFVGELCSNIMAAMPDWVEPVIEEVSNFFDFLTTVMDKSLQGMMQTALMTVVALPIIINPRWSTAALAGGGSTEFSTGAVVVLAAMLAANGGGGSGGGIDDKETFSDRGSGGGKKPEKPEKVEYGDNYVSKSEGSSKAVSINPNEIRFSQSSVNGAEEIIQSMKANGWKGDPIDVIKMSDGKLTTIDNTRVVAAREAGIEVKANLHEANEPLPKELVERFTTKKGVPTTWGEAIELRIGKQNASFRNDNPLGADTMEKVGK